MAKKIKTGRKKIEHSEKVILVGFYTKRKFVEALGGMDKVRDMCKGEVEGQAHDRGHW